MRKLIIFFCFIFLSSLLYGQQLPQYSLYMLNEVIVNPAALSKEKNNKVTLMLTDQWSGFEGAPTTQSISYNHLNHNKFKAGISLMNDVTFNISVLNATLSGSYSIPLQGKDRFAFGASASIMQHRFDNSVLKTATGALDPAIGGGVDKQTGSSVAAGFYYYHPDYYIGFSVPNIVAISTFSFKVSSVSSGLTTTSERLQNCLFLKTISEQGLVPKSYSPSLLPERVAIF